MQFLCLRSHSCACYTFLLEWPPAGTQVMNAVDCESLKVGKWQFCHAAGSHVGLWEGRQAWSCSNTEFQPTHTVRPTRLNFTSLPSVEA